MIHRHFPEDRRARELAREALCRIEFGWGPWGALAMTRVCDWEIGVQVSGGKLLDVWPCFQSGPFDEKRRNRIFGRTERSVQIVSYTSRQDAFAQRATNAVILRVAGGSSATLEIRVKRPSERTVRKTLGELAADNEVEYTGPFQSESMLVHRLVDAGPVPRFFQNQRYRHARRRRLVSGKSLSGERPPGVVQPHLGGGPRCGKLIS